MKIRLEQQEKGKELYQELVQKAWESAAFKEQLISNPEKTISEIIGVNPSSNARILVEDQTDSNIIYLNIPKKIDLENFELTDDQLESISGGDRNFGENVGYYGAMFFDWLGDAATDLAISIGESEMNNIGPKY
jgi:Fe-S cluster biosynthesis and repair protein YggX